MAIDHALISVLGDLGQAADGLVVDVARSGSPADRERAVDAASLVATLHRAALSDLVSADDASYPPLLPALQALRRQALDLRTAEHPLEAMSRLEQAIGEATRLMSIVGKWPPTS